MAAPVSDEEIANIFYKQLGTEPPPTPAPAESEGTLVNEKVVQDAFYKNLGDLGVNLQTPQDVEEERQANLPKSWFGEYKQGVARGVDQIQQVGAGIGMMASRAVGADKLAGAFEESWKQQERDLFSEPASVPTYEGVDSFDTFMRYAIGSLGELTPQMTASFVGGGAGSLGGKAVYNMLPQLVERQAVKSVLNSEVADFVKDELKSKLVESVGQVGRTGLTRALSPEANAVLVNETKNLMAKYGSWGGVGLNSWAQETGSIYNDLKDDPNVSESDRRASALVGGLIAALPDTALQGYIASKFFPGVKNVGKEQLDEASSYLTRFAKSFGKNIPKYSAAEGGQELAQTIVEEAAKNWADPSKRDAIFTFTEEQKVAFLDATFKGAIGGAAMGAGGAVISTPFHSNPKVREAERRIESKMVDADPSILSGESDSDIALSEIAQKRASIEAEKQGELPPERIASLDKELEMLDLEEAKILQEDQSSVNESGQTTLPETTNESEKAPVRATTPIEKAVTHLRAFYAQKMGMEGPLPVQKRATPEQLETVSEDIKSLVNEISDSTPENNQAYAQGIQSAITPDVRNFLAAEGIQIRVATQEEISDRLGGEEAFAAMDLDENGNYVLLLPRASRFFTEAESLANFQSESAKAKTDYVQNIGKVIEHEIIHLADGVAIRNQWKAEGRKENWTVYESRIMRERGALMRKALKAMGKSPKIIVRAYRYGSAGNFDNMKQEEVDRMVGQEMTRMMIEFARTGRLTEVTEALQKAEREAKLPEAKGAISQFLDLWIESIKNLYDTLKEFIDPKTTPPEVLKAFHDINNVLDQYGLLVNERKTEANNEKAESKIKKEVNVSPSQPKIGLTVKQALATNAKVEFEGKRGRLAKDTDGALILKTAKEDILIQDVANDDMPLSEMGVAPTKPNAIAIAIANLKDSHPSDIQAAAAEIEIPNEPYWYRDATSDGSLLDKIDIVIETGESKLGRRKTLVNETSEYRREVDKITPEMLDRAESIIVNTLDRIDGLDVSEEQKSNLSIPIEDIWHGIEGIRKTKSAIETQRAEARAEKQLKDEQYQEASRQSSSEGVIGAVQSEATPEVSKEPQAKKRRSREEVAEEKLKSAIKGKDLLAATRAFIAFRNLQGKPLSAREFKAMYGKGATLKAFNDFLSLTKKPAAKAASPAEAIAHGMGIKFDGVAFGSRWQFTNQNEDQPSYGYTFTTEIGADEETIRQALQDENTKAATNEIVDLDALLGGLGFPPQDEKPPAMAATPKSVFPTTKVNKVVYHSGPIGIEKFISNDGIFFTTDKNRANELKEDAGVSSKVYEAFVNIENPLDESQIGKFRKWLIENPWTYNPRNQMSIQVKRIIDGGPLTDIEVQYFPDLFEAAMRENNWDGVISFDEVVVFDTDQVFIVNEKKPAAMAARPSLAREDRYELDRLMRQQAIRGMSVAGLMPQAESRERERGGAIDYTGIDARQMFYNTQPRGETARVAAEVVRKNGGPLRVAQKLIEDPMGTWLNLQEDATSDYPNAYLGAVYQFVMEQMSAVRGSLKGDPRGAKFRQYLIDLHESLEDWMRHANTATGQFNDITGKIIELYDGDNAIKKLRNFLFSNLERVLGKNAKAEMVGLTSRINAALVNEMPSFVKTPRFMSMARKLMKFVTGQKWEKGYRQTVISQVDDLMALAKKAAARMAQFTGMAQDSNAYTTEYITRLVKEMSGLPKEQSAKEELQVVREMLGKVTREYARQKRLMGETIKVDKLSMQEQMAIVLKNDSLYREFADGLTQAYIEQYGGQNPSEEWIADAQNIGRAIANRMYDTESLNTLVNEKMREFKVKIAEIAKAQYRTGELRIESMKQSIRDFMREEGVENEGLVDALVDDVQTAMDEKVNAARERFFGSKKALTGVLKDLRITDPAGFIKTLSINLTDAVTDWSINPDSLMESFEEHLVRAYGFPNTADMPLASSVAKVLMKSLGEKAADQNAKLIQQWLDKSQRSVDQEKLSDIEKQNKKKKLKSSVDKVLALAKAGVMEQEDIYTALADEFGLPPWKEETAQQILQLGEKMAQAKSQRQKDNVRNDLAGLLSQTKPLKTSDAYVSWMYFSMLSGPGTQMINFVGNALGLASYFSTEAIKHPGKAFEMARAMFRAGIGSGYAEARESWFWGTALGKDGNKYFKGKNIAEIDDPFFEDRFSGVLAEGDKRLAKFTNTLLKGVPYLRPKYVGRLLTATDMWFYKMSLEMALAARGQGAYTPQMWDSALVQANEELRALGMDPNENRANKARRDTIANSILDDMRRGDPSLVNEKTTAWVEAHQEALEATFQQRPTGFLGAIARLIEKLSDEFPTLKAIVPFTQVAANITNFMLDWTPVGMGRYLISNAYDKTNPFYAWTYSEEHGKVYNAHIDQAIRATLGMGAMMLLTAMAAQDADEPDPDFAIYGDGPRDPTLRRIWMNKGGRPNTIKVGGVIVSYVYWPTAMGMSIIGRRFDDYREGTLASPYDFSLTRDAVGILEAVKNQSFLVSIGDLFGAIDSPNPERRLTRLAARIGSIPLPNAFKQIDRAISPSLNEAEGFWESWIKEIPIWRGRLDESLNYFGEPVKRAQGIIPFPGMERFATWEKTNDPVLNLVSERNFKLPGYSKSTRLNGEPIGDKMGEYIRLAGPRIYSRIQANIHTLRQADKEDAQRMLEDIATEEKRRAMDELRAKYPKP